MQVTLLEKIKSPHQLFELLVLSYTHALSNLRTDMYKSNLYEVTSMTPPLPDTSRSDQTHLFTLEQV